MEKNTFFSSLVVMIFILSSFAVDVSSDEAPLYKISGKVYVSDGVKAGDTSIKVDSGDSIWTDSNGEYEITDISPGEHVVRAYFMDNGHTVSYRKIFFESDIELDWYVGKNWITAEMFDASGEHVDNSPTSTVKLVETDESHSLQGGRTEFGPLEIGAYYSLRAYYGDIDHSTQFIHFRMEGSIPNDFDFNHGMNSRYGFIKSENGEPMSDIKVSNGSVEVVSNDDGFFLFENLKVGTTQTFTFKRGNIEVAEPKSVDISDGMGWINITTFEEVKYPESPYFITQTQVLSLSMLPLDIEWKGGNHTLFYTLNTNEEKVYEGFAEKFLFQTEEPGNFEFQIGATNSNGTTNSTQKLLIMVLPEESIGDLWKAGMSWDYQVSYSPISVSPDPNGVHNVKLTVLGKEQVVDAYGNEKETFLLRKNDDYYLEEEKSYHWVDSNNLLPLKTYWEDAPSSSSYFQEGTLGWLFTDDNGNVVSLLDSNKNLSLHFNRTNIIGVPGHPNGYDDTMSSVSIKQNVMVETVAGVFSTTYISIVDNNDGIASWELWYNKTVKNWVKKIDRLPGSHAEKVEYNLTSFYVPFKPQFITEDGGNYNNNDYFVEWAPFQGAEGYRLIENGELIYSGNATKFYLENQVDGNYEYELYAVLTSEALVKGKKINITLIFVPETPTIITPSQTISKGESLFFSWEYGEKISWYSVILENEAGVKTEIYNGTENSTIFDSLDIGQNRIRVQAKLSNGKLSGLSDSVFIKVEENEADSPTVSLTSAIVLLSLLSIINRKRRN